MNNQEITGSPAAADQGPGFGDHIVQYSKLYSTCAGCETCTIMCGLTHEGFIGHGNGRVQLEIGTVDMMHTVLSCQQCEDHPCYNACPRKDKAMCIDPENGMVFINEEACIGCGMCERACRFTPSRIYMKRSKVRKEWRAVKCDLCRGREGGPACIEWCPVRCIGLASASVLKDGEWFPKEKEEEKNA